MPAGNADALRGTTCITGAVDASAVFSSITMPTVSTNAGLALAGSDQASKSLRLRMTVGNDPIKEAQRQQTCDPEYGCADGSEASAETCFRHRVRRTGGAEDGKAGAGSPRGLHSEHGDQVRVQARTFPEADVVWMVAARCETHRALDRRVTKIIRRLELAETKFKPS